MVPVDDKISDTSQVVGTFIKWLEEQGAGQVAALATAALHRTAASPREMLEQFLIDTGQVARPSMVLRP